MGLAAGAPGRTYDACFLRHTGLLRNMAGQGLPNKTVALDDYWESPLVTVGDFVFPSFNWLVKAIKNNTGNEKERNYNLKLNRVPVVTEIV